MAILFRFEKNTLPRALALKDRVEQGEALSSSDIDFLSHAMTEIQQCQSLIKQQPEYHSVGCQAVWLYSQVITQALEIEKQITDL